MDFSAPRYCQVPLPRYRFMPGQFPHPTAHPEGHSYRPPDEPAAEVEYKSPDVWFESVDYLYGCDLYNHGYWWEAHEAWEGLWQLTDKNGQQGRFLQGLIQVSACHLQLHRGHFRGVQRLRCSSAERIESALGQVSSECFMGLAVRAWLTKVQEYYDMLFAGDPQAPVHDAENYPYIVLRQ